MANITMYEQHFTLLEKIINDLELTKKPENIFNCDESKGTRDHITVNACISANGLVLPLHIIFAGAFPSVLYARDSPDGRALYSISDNGYMDPTLFYVFMDQLFIPKTRQ